MQQFMSHVRSRYKTTTVGPSPTCDKDSTKVRSCCRRTPAPTRLIATSSEMPASFVATVVCTRPKRRDARWATSEQAAMPDGANT